MNYRIPIMRIGAGVLVLLVAFGLFSGCRSPKSGLNLDAENWKQESDIFREGADRVPTMKTLYAYAKLVSTEGYDAEAEKVLRNILDANPDFVPAYNSLAEVQMRQQRVEDAIHTLEVGLEVSPGDPTLLNNLGMCTMADGDYEKALEHFTEAAEKRPNNARYLANMGVALAMVGREEEAYSLFQQILPESDVEHNLAILSEARKARQAAGELLDMGTGEQQHGRVPSGGDSGRREASGQEAVE